MRQHGFTLLETLIALVLMSLLMVALFGSFRAGIASWQVVDSHVEHTEPQLLLGRMLYRHFSQVKIFSSVPGFGKVAVSDSFQGYTGRVRYIAPLAQSVDDQLYVIELTSNPEGHSGVWIKYVPFETLDIIEDQLGQAEYQLISAELEIEFSYFVGAEWVTELDKKNAPRLVRVSWRSAERLWADSVFAITRG